jgi:hypothetical protein
LNVLHDGSKFSGPLRTHLHCTTPRFIYRYHEIQYQITHLTTTAEAGDESNVERQEHDGAFYRQSVNVPGTHPLHIGQRQPQLEQFVVEDEATSGEQPEEYSEHQWQEHPTNEAEETETHEETVTGDIPNYSEELLEKQGQVEEKADPAEAQNNNASPESYEFHEDQDEPSGAVDITGEAAVFDLERQEDLHGGDEDADEASEHLDVDAPTHDEDGDNHAPEGERTQHVNYSDSSEAPHPGAELTYDGDDAQGLFHPHRPEHSC